MAIMTALGMTDNGNHVGNHIQKAITIFEWRMLIKLHSKSMMGISNLILFQPHNSPNDILSST